MRAATLLAVLLAAAPLAAQAPVPAQEVPLAEAAAPADDHAAPPPADTRPQPAPGSPFSWGDAGHLEFHARNLPVADVFAELRRLVRRNIIVAPEVNAHFTGDLYDVSVDEIIDAICRSTNLVARPMAAYIYVEPDQAETRVYTLRHLRADDLLPLVRPLLSPSGQCSGTPAAKQGIPSSQEASGGDDYAAAEMIIVRDVATRLAEIDKVVATMDCVPRQVLIEATILVVALNDDMQMGVELQGLLGVDFAEAGAFSPQGQSLAYGGFNGGTLQDGLAAADTNVNSLLSTGGLNVGIFKDSVAVFVRALQSVTDTTVLANPRVVTMNKQRGEVLLGRRDGFLTTTVTQTSTTQSVDYLETGTRLIFRPFIADDDLVRLEIHPEDSNGGLNEAGLPFKTTAEVTTNVMVRSGETVVIGGLFRTKDGTITNKVPLLGDIPVLGQLFRSDDTTKVREEIIIVLTPHILDPAKADSMRDAGLDAEPLHDEVQKRTKFPTLPDKSVRPAGDKDGTAGGDGPSVDAGDLAATWRDVLRRLAQAPDATTRVVLRGLQRSGGDDAELAALRRRLVEPLPACEGLAALDARILAARGVAGQADVVKPQAPPPGMADAGPDDEVSELWKQLFGGSQP